MIYNHKVMPFFLIVTMLVLSSITFAGIKNQNCNLTQVTGEIDSLDPFIGQYPPSFKSRNDIKLVKKKYDKIENELNVMLTKCTNMNQILKLRGDLYVMGHNMDLPDAFEKARKDYASVINNDPKNEETLIALGQLYTSTNPVYAPQAEKLFLAAQSFHGEEPLYGAHFGLIFSYYYQGKIKDALKEARFARKLWPNDQGLERLYYLVSGVDKSKSAHSNP